MEGKRRPSETYVGRLHLVGVLTLVVITAALLAIGWSLRPASGGFPRVTSNVGVFVPTGTVTHLSERLTMSAGGGARLELVDPETVDRPVPAWRLYFTGVTPAHVCMPPGYTCGLKSGAGALSRVKVPRQRVTKPHLPNIGDAVYITEVRGTGFVYVRVCWSAGAPAATNGTYLNAVLPSVHSVAPNAPEAVISSSRAITTQRQLNVGTTGTDTAPYTLQSVVQPDAVTSGGWKWSSTVPAAAALTVTAVNTDETQKDTYRAFLSGILFGIAGGALIALIQELVAPFRSGAELRPPEPGA